MAFYLKNSNSEFWISCPLNYPEFSNIICDILTVCIWVYRNESKVKDTVKIKDVWCFIDHRKSQAWELSADKSGKRVFWVTYGQIFKDETREECALVGEKENIAQPQKKVTHNLTQSHILDLSVKLFVLMPVHFFTFLFPR